MGTKSFMRSVTVWNNGWIRYVYVYTSIPVITENCAIDKGEYVADVKALETLLALN